MKELTKQEKRIIEIMKWANSEIYVRFRIPNKYFGRKSGSDLTLKE